MKRLVGALAIMLFLSSASSASAGEKVVIGELNWSGSTAIEELLDQILTEYFDADVSRISAAQEALYEALDKGDGSVDIVADMWTDHLPEQMANYVVEGSRETIILNEPYLGTEGYFVPAFVAEEYGITKLSDLANPENAKLFDSDNNGKGEIWGGSIGWETVNHTEIRLKSYELAPVMEMTNVDQAVILAQLKDAIDTKTPIVFYYWTPEWIHAKYDLVRLEEPAFDGYAMESAQGSERYNPDGCFTFYQPTERNDWLEASSITCGQPPTHVSIAHSRALAERAPEISQFLRQVNLDADMINAWILAMDVDGRPVDEVIAEWIGNNRATIETEWMAGIGS